MTAQISQEQQDFENSMISAKLSGTVATISLDVAWEGFSEYVDTLIAYLEDEWEIIMTPQQVINRPSVLALYLKNFRESLADEGYDNQDYDYHGDMHTLFKAEIKEAERIAAEKRKEELRLQKEALEADRIRREEERRLFDLNGVVIKVDAKHHKKALAILVAAGLVK